MTTAPKTSRPCPSTPSLTLSGSRLRFALVLFSSLACAMPAAGRMTETPVSFREAVTPLAAISRLELAPVDVDSLRAEDRAAEEGLRPTPVRFAMPIPVAVDPAGAGNWEDLADGARLWRLRIASPGALSLNLFFSRFDLPEGAGVWIYDLRGRRIEGRYGPNDRTPEGQLWTPVILGDEIVLELYLPAGAVDSGLELGAVNHGYRFFGELPTKQGACNIDVICPEADPYRDQVRAVAVYSRGGIFICTGQIVNNTALDFRPFFLTAQHCGVNAGNASSMVVYWNYESPSCGQLSGGSLADNQMGASLRASYQPSDMTLVELDQRPELAFDVYYAGWDAVGMTPQSVVAIHHPSTDEKAIAIENDRLDSVHVDGYGEPGDENHWLVNAWDVGTTEPGSSGACIFDQATRNCVGTLTGGTASCGFREGFDVFAKFSRSWTGGGTPDTRLSDWLDPVGGGNTLELDGSDQGGGGGCRPDALTACLRNRRFAVRASWSVPSFGMGPAGAVPGSSDESVNLFFFDAENWEMLVKVLDGCSYNGRYWVFVAGATDVGWELTVEDTIAGESWSAGNPFGNTSPAITDANAFATCP